MNEINFAKEEEQQQQNQADTFEGNFEQEMLQTENYNDFVDQLQID